MPQNIFGTDGVRGVANADLSCDLAFRLGRAATKFLGPDICIGRDTRLSGTMLESALTAGIMAEGGRPHCCGVIPTPAVALLTVQNELDGGIVISASHNPPEFNGIKFFSRKGMKLPDAVEEEISAWVTSVDAASTFRRMVVSRSCASCWSWFGIWCSVFNTGVSASWSATPYSVSAMFLPL